MIDHEEKYNTLLKVEWTKKDDFLLEKCIEAVCGRHDSVHKDEQKKWLKSLKDKIKSIIMEDYKKKYEDALKKAKENKPLEEIFPELKESEDERIKNEIIAFVEQSIHRGGGTPVPQEQEDKWIAWLEKHGEKTNPYSGISFEYNGHTWGMCARDNGVDILCDKHLIKHLEKQDGQKSNGKVESKFHEGDWVVCEVTGSVYQIKNCIENLSNHKCGYDLTNGGYIGSNEVNHYRLWTIQDAKDGDVLYSIDSKQPFIYKERPQFSQARGYCCINKFGEFAIWNTSKCVICTDKYIPATKEQRDTLFEMMKEAEYEWDAEKKELKKIEQKPAWSEYDQIQLDEAIQMVESNGTWIRSEDAVKKVSDWLKSLNDRVLPQNTWKPSDEQMDALNDVISSRDIKYDVLSELWKDLKKLKS